MGNSGVRSKFPSSYRDEEQDNSKPLSPHFATLEPYILRGIPDVKKRNIGSGSYAVVKELELGDKKCAGKQLHKILFENASPEEQNAMLTRFADECKLLRSIEHPNIVEFLGVHVDQAEPQLPYLVMEFLNGNLSSYLEKHGIQDASASFSILSDVAFGLQYLHSQKPPIIHRDLSANNVLLTSDLLAKISDLGVAKIWNFSPTHLTQTKVPGTPSYMPPEAVIDSPKYSANIDCFSFGVLIIHTLCAEWPIPGPSTKPDPNNPDSVVGITEFNRRSAFVEKIGRSHPLMNLVRKCLHNSPHNRPAMESVVKDILEIQEACVGADNYSVSVTHKAVHPYELNLTDGDIVRVYGDTRRELWKAQLITSGCVGYVPPQHLQDNPVFVYMAKYDFDNQAENHLSLRKGERMYIIAQSEEDWWLAKSWNGEQTGYIPSNYVAKWHTLNAEDWFFGCIGCREAEQLLMQPPNTPGAYLVRESESLPGDFALSCCKYDQILHCRISKLHDGTYCALPQTAVTFQGIQELVSHYIQQQQETMGPHMHPCSVPEKPGTAGLSKETNEDWDIDRHQITLKDKIGEGGFTEVWDGLWNGATRVAVKMIMSDSVSLSKHFKVLQQMRKLHHPKVVQLYGVSTKGEPAYIINEFLSHGDLQTYLQRERKDLALPQLTYLSSQIACGMAYLEKQSFVHGSLSTRNVLVGANMICKVADYGLAGIFGVHTSVLQGEATFQWTAPEVSTPASLTTMSDAWSFGTVLYEIVTYCDPDYPNMTHTEVIDSIQQGYRLPQPKECGDKLYNIMLNCWMLEPEKRPSFSTLRSHLDLFFAC